jgi:hypothetical protein
MKKTLYYVVLVLAAGLILGLAGCADDDDDDDGEFAKYYARTFNDNHLGNVTVINPTSFDMLLFHGENLVTANIIGGVKANDETLLNFSSKPNFNVGGPALVRAVRQSIFATQRSTSRPDYSAPIVYGRNRPATATIVSVTHGDFRYYVTNRSLQYALDLRAGALRGERVAFLDTGRMDAEIRTHSSSTVGLFPVWVGFNTKIQEMVSFTPVGVPLTIQTAFPRPEGEQVHSVAFPQGGSNIIEFPIEFPTAVIRIVNSTPVGVTFRNATTPQRGSSGFEGLIPGVVDSYEIEADILGFNLNFLVGGLHDNIVVPIRFEDAPNASSVTLENGWLYTVELNRLNEPGHTAADYEAILVKRTEQSNTDVIEAFK